MRHALMVRSFLGLVWILVVGGAGLGAGCSFELDMCQIDDECDRTASCVEGLCKEKPRVEVVDNIGTDTTWTADRVWVLNDVITVVPSTTLTIEPGTTILGRQHSALVVRSGGTLDATGTRDRPIVFTSYEPAGQRLPGDWGGVAMLGQAPVNREEAQLRIKPGELEPSFGGTDVDSYCGTLRYVRVEFAGGRIQGEDYLNSLSLCGCGKRTVIEYVQLHYGGDDGLEIFGGTVDFRYLVVTRTGDEGVDIDLGWTGTGQFLAVQLDAAAEGSVEVDNLKEDASAIPLTDFRIYNFTLIGSPDSNQQRAINIKHGGAGFMSHGIIQGHSLEAVEIWGLEAGARALAGESIVRDTLFYDIGPDGESYFPVAGDPDEDDGSGDDDGGFPEDQFYIQPEWNNVFGVDPLLTDAYDLLAPGWVPESPAILGVDPPPAPFDPTANYRGAFAPNAVPWTEGWTAYPDS